MRNAKVLMVTELTLNDEKVHWNELNCTHIHQFDKNLGEIAFWNFQWVAHIERERAREKGKKKERMRGERWMVKKKVRRCIFPLLHFCRHCNERAESVHLTPLCTTRVSIDSLVFFQRCVVRFFSTYVYSFWYAYWCSRFCLHVHDRFLAFV